MERIIHDGFLRPTAINIAPDELPVLWFSKNDQFEPTAAKGMITPDGGVKLMTHTQMAQMLGIFRFSLPDTDIRLISWQRLPMRAKIPKKTVRYLIDVGVKRGAKPNDWVGTLVPIPLPSLVCERYNMVLPGWEPHHGPTL
jgi:hypothetical protein